MLQHQLPIRQRLLCFTRHPINAKNNRSLRQTHPLRKTFPRTYVCYPDFLRATLPHREFATPDSLRAALPRRYSLSAAWPR